MNLLLALLLGGIVLFCAVKSYLRKRNHYGSLRSLPSVPLNLYTIFYMILIQNVQDFHKTVLGYSLLFLRTKIGYVFWVFTHPFVVLSTPAGVEALCRSRNTGKPREYDAMRAIFQDGLITVNDMEKWRRNRKILTPTFHYLILADYARIFREHGERLVDYLRATEGPVNVYYVLQRATFDTICDAMLGKNFDSLHQPDLSFFNACCKVEAIAMRRMSRPWLMNDTLFRLLGPEKQFNEYVKSIRDLGDKLIEERWAEREAEGWAVESESDPRRRAFLDLLIDLVQLGKLRKVEIRQELDTFLSAGHETITLAMTWTCLCLAHDPGAQDRIRAETKANIHSNDDYTLDNVKNLVYLEQCVKEAMRLYPPVPVVGRIIEEPLDIEGVRIPVGATVSFMPYNLHRNPEYWEDPEVFRPERFQASESVGRHPFAFLPFSAGARNCIGQKFAMLETKILMSQLISNFRLEPLQHRHEVEPVVELGLKPPNGLQLILHPL